ncbi:MAG: hypothetical protein R3E68_02510 [Burkholderiaceae bacterium]
MNLAHLRNMSVTEMGIIFPPVPALRLPRPRSATWSTTSAAALELLTSTRSRTALAGLQHGKPESKPPQGD